MILSQVFIYGAILYSLSIAEVQNIHSLNPATMVWIYEFLSATGCGVTFPFLFTQYKMLTICGRTSRLLPGTGYEMEETTANSIESLFKHRLRVVRRSPGRLLTSPAWRLANLYSRSKGETSLSRQVQIIGLLVFPFFPPFQFNKC